MEALQSWSVNGKRLRLENDLNIRWDCDQSRCILVSPLLPQSMERPEADWSVDAFELKEPLYKGTTSLVYLATDKKSMKTVVLKLYRKSKLAILNRFQVEREIRLHSDLRHPNVIQLFVAFEDTKYVYLVQEYAEQGDLFCLVRKEKRKLGEAELIRTILLPFLRSLQYLHSKGIVHRDIKPENIFVKSDGTIKIADFGLSINMSRERPVTRAGTLDYMAPEVLKCPSKTCPEDNKHDQSLVYDSKVDIWAVGILAYELLAGSPPFEQESRSETYDSIVNKDPVFPDGISSAAKDFILQTLAKGSEERPTVAAVLQHRWIVNNSDTVNERAGLENASQKESESTEPAIAENREVVAHSAKEKSGKFTANDKRSTQTNKGATLDTNAPIRSQARSTTDIVQRTPSLPPIARTRKKKAPTFADDFHVHNPSLIFDLAHHVCSKTEDTSVVSETEQGGLCRLPSYSFFPKNKHRTEHPAHRLNRELTGSKNSFTDKIAPEQQTRTSTPLTVIPESFRQKQNEDKNKRCRRLSFLPFRKNRS